jgi:DNA-binding response OmpR family regulator
MDNSTISVFGSKTFFEIINELDLFKESKFNYYNDLELCIKNAEKQNDVVLAFCSREHLNFLDKIKNSFPMILISNLDIKNKVFLHYLKDQLKMPFTIMQLQKKITSINAKSKFKKNSLIQLNNYTIDKNERKIKKGDLELQLSEKEINFLVLFAVTVKPISKDLVLKKVWNYSDKSETHTVETHIHRLRKKIFEKFGDEKFIKHKKNGYYI